MVYGGKELLPCLEHSSTSQELPKAQEKERLVSGVGMADKAEMPIRIMEIARP